MIYEPKKRQYSDLRSLFDEMKKEGHKVLDFNGWILKTKEATYMMYEGEVLVKANGND